MRGPASVTGSQGDALVSELRWVHRLIRRDLQIIEQLAADLGAGLAGEDAAAAITSLEVGSPIWQLKINCLQYCSFVHSHHHAESAMLFPRLRLSNPSLGPVVDKLEADHARVSDLLDDVSAAAIELTGQDVAGQSSAGRNSAGQESAGPDSEGARKRLIDALTDLAAELLAHLDYEEENISDTLRTWTTWW